MNASAVPTLIQQLRTAARRTGDRTSRITLQRLEQRLDRASAERLPAVAAEVLVALRAKWWPWAGSSGRRERPSAG